MVSLAVRNIANVIEFVGAVCLVVAAAYVATALAWAVAGVALLGKAYELDLAKRQQQSAVRRAA